MEAIQRHGAELTDHAVEALSEVPRLVQYGLRGEDRRGTGPFNLQGVHPHDVGTILDREVVAVRTGHHRRQQVSRVRGTRHDDGKYSSLQSTR
jgi:cysteine desulfurase/selenocysteine lyase